MALSSFVAQALLEDYLGGRTLPDALRGTVVREVEAKLIDGDTPVLSEDLCRKIDRAAADGTRGDRSVSVGLDASAALHAEN